MRGTGCRKIHCEDTTPPPHHHHHTTTPLLTHPRTAVAAPGPGLCSILSSSCWAGAGGWRPGPVTTLTSPPPPPRPPAPAPGLRPRPHLPRPRPLHGGAGRGGEQRQSSRDSAPRNTQLPHTAANTGAATAGQLAAEPRTGREGNFICFLFRDCFGPASLSRDSLAW